MKTYFRPNKENGFTSFRHNLQYELNCNISASKMCEVMNLILINYCKVSVCGYNKTDDEYWGKQINNNVCDLFFQILVKNTGEHNSSIIIVPTIGTKLKIINLCKIIKNVIELCEMID